jgi:hypothetical protein
MIAIHIKKQNPRNRDQARKTQQTNTYQLGKTKIFTINKRKRKSKHISRTLIFSRVFLVTKQAALIKNKQKHQLRTEESRHASA